MRLALFCCLLFSSALFGDSQPMTNPIAIVIHGGAGTIHKDNFTAEKEAAYRGKLQEAVQAGYAILNAGGSSEAAVIAAIVVMEDSELFNAGHGAVLNHEGEVELDASIMVGSDLSAGAIAGVQHIRNPILLAAEVLNHSPHVMLVGEGAEQFAQERGFELIDNTYFRTQRRKDQLQRVKDRISLSEDMTFENDKQLGTVGAVAVDQMGVISAGTSTGGMTNKRFGRIGDSPIIGAGTYADDNCGISATGHGEYFIRAVVAHDICARVRYQSVTLREAADEVVNQKLVGMGADGGVIGLDREANVTTPFNSLGMYRAFIDKSGKMSIDIFR